LEITDCFILKLQKTSNAGDALARLYDFDDNPDRKKFLDQLLRFMEEKGSPISACPTISKNPLDLFRLYLLVRDRGGFVEVTKNKAWKDVATSLGIGASSSAAYTLRKHYTKNLFPWECKFDRGGIDPGPIINQVSIGNVSLRPSPLRSPLMRFYPFQLITNQSNGCVCI
jgi:AT-rich interactive domain-containing protein 1